MLKEFFDKALVELNTFKGEYQKRNGQVELRDKWNQRPEFFRGNADTFYEEVVGDSYLYDLATWHASRTLYPWGQKVHRAARGVCWDFGGGIGTYSLLMAKSPLVDRVYFDDINPENREFAAWRFERHEVLNKIEIGPPRERVDTLIALDVIEHLSEPFWWLGRFNDRAIPGAKMVVNITSHTSHGEHPMHIVDEFATSKWWRALGDHWVLEDSGSPSIWRRNDRPA